MFCIGEFDDNRGELIPMVPVKIISALEAVAKARRIENDALVNFERSINGEDSEDIHDAT